MGFFNNEHPPLMAFAWRYLEKLLPGGAGLFLFHGLLFWIGFALFVSRVASSRGQALIACVGVSCFLPLLLSFGMLVKDGGFAYALALSSAALLRAERSRSIAWIVVSMCALLYAVGLRHNGLGAALPLALWAGIIAAPRWQAMCARIGQAKTATALGLIAFLYVGVGANLANRLLTSQEAYPAQMMLTWDITGVSVLSGRNYLPEFMTWDRRELTLDELARVYSPESNYFILWGPRTQPRPGWVYDDEGYAELRAAWIRAVREHPIAYLSHRMSAFIRFLGFRIRARAYWYPPSREIAAGRAWNSAIQSRLIGFAESHPQLIFFKAWFYVAIVALCVAVGARRRFASVAFWAIGASGILYECSYLFVSTAGDFRYSWWIMCVALMLPALLARDLARRPGASRGPGPSDPGCRLSPV